MPPPDCLRVPLTALGTGVCRFPLGDPRQADFAFCGAAADEDKSYCDFHHHLTHEGTAARARRQLRSLASQARAGGVGGASSYGGRSIHPRTYFV